MLTEQLQDQIKHLTEKNAKLEKINQALIKRVEEGGGNQYAPYSAFEHSVHLADQVREKTHALNETLAELEQSNRALKHANHQAGSFRQRFADAIESISDAFVLLDCDGRIVFQNSHFSEFWRNSKLSIDPGVNLKDLKELAKSKGIIRQAYPGDAVNSPVYQLNDGRWFQLNERRTIEGGWVMLYTDITALKVAESARFDRAMAQKSRLLQNLVDNLSQGVVMLSASNQIEVWNKRFSEISHLSPQILKSSPYFSNLQHLTELDLEPKTGNKRNDELQTLSNGTVLEIREHQLVSGELIKTFTDITQRHRYAQSLKKSKNWLKLITDNVPAMIAYIGNDLKFQFTNRVYLDWYGLKNGDLNDVTLEDSRIFGDYNILEPYVNKALTGQSVSFEIDENNTDGTISHLLKSYVPNKDAYGHVLGFFVLVRNVTQRRQNAKALQKSYDELEIRVEQRTSQLQTLNSQLQVEIEQHNKAQLNLITAKSEAEQANNSKTKFLAAVSHDLLQPLNAAQLFTSSVSELLQDDEIRHLVNCVSNSLDDLENLICTLVDISKLDAGVVTADKNSFKLSDLLTNMVHEYRQIAPQFDIELRYVSSELVIHSDSFLLARILRNFLTNAFRYGAKGKVLIGARRVGNNIRIEVLDNGVGIAENQLTEIFKEFKRLKGSSKACSNGLGLGLAIVDKLSKVLEHPIKVESISGQGSVFSVLVPGGTIKDIQRDYATLVTPQVQLQNSKVWIVDNDQSICDGMGILLSNWDCEVVTALDYDDLASQVSVANDAVDLLILDYHLDDNVTGLDVAQQINAARGQQTELPIIMITANYSKSLKVATKDAGILLLNKPIKPMKLKTSMLYLLK